MNRSEAGRLGYLKVKDRLLDVSRQQSDIARARFSLLDKKCKNCNASILYEKRENDFCSQSCSAVFSNTRRVRHKNCDAVEPDVCGNPIHIVRNCEFCGVVVKNKYCSLKCQALLGWKNRRDQIIATGDVGNRPLIAKRILKELGGHECRICNGKEWMGKPIPLILDHIDGHAENNKLENLRLVCGNCDMQLPTYKSKNKGNGRAWRRQRYKEGKSY